MEALAELLERLNQERPDTWDALPDIALYMDQLISYMPRQLIRFDEGDKLTSAMVNNYIKGGLLPRARGKRYGKEHLAYLTAICALKQVLSVREIGGLIEAGRQYAPPTGLYEIFQNQLDDALTSAAHTLDGAETARDLPRLALELALQSYACRLACQRVLAIIEEAKPPEAEGKKKKRGQEHE